jgi:YidC/Oxa1 family membrane protein insertase
VEQRRLVIFVLISVIVIIGYTEVLRRIYGRPQTVAERSLPPEVQRPPSPTETPPPPSSGLTAPTGDGSAPVVVDTDMLHVVITPAGARLIDVQLKDYRRTVAPDSDLLDLVQPGPLLPATLQIGPQTSDAQLAYRPDRTEIVLHAGEHGEVAFTADSPAGVHIEKRYRFNGEGYLFDVAVALSGEHIPPSVGFIVTPLPADMPSTKAQTALALANRRLVEKHLPDMLKQPASVESSAWAGFATQYFMSVAVTPDAALPSVFTASDGIPIVRLDAGLVEGRAGFSVYSGPKERQVLAHANHDLDRALDFGMFWFIAIPLLYALHVLQKATGNYGVAIIVLTAMVKLVTAPLTRTTFRNMREMQKIQPQMAKLRERFKDDQAALQKEMMELYRRHRVNPFSGCLPMLLQLPIFVGLYNALSHAIELRHAPFALWINDLSAPDRLLIPGIPAATPFIGSGVPVLTLLMGASMFLQQWLTPQQGDPAQQRMMMFMPLLFTFMFMNFPAGLVLYWLVNNVLTIGQQYLMMRSAK